MKIFSLALAVLLAASLCEGGPLRFKRAAFYIANETACVVDHTVYYSGDPIPTDDPCEACRCRPPGFACILKDCEVQQGCRAVRKLGECCPEYVCDASASDQDESKLAVTTEVSENSEVLTTKATPDLLLPSLVKTDEEILNEKKPMKEAEEENLSESKKPILDPNVVTETTPTTKQTNDVKASTNIDTESVRLEHENRLRSLKNTEEEEVHEHTHESNEHHHESNEHHESKVPTSTSVSDKIGTETTISSVSEITKVEEIKPNVALTEQLQKFDASELPIVVESPVKKDEGVKEESVDEPKVDEEKKSVSELVPEEILIEEKKTEEVKVSEKEENIHKEAPSNVDQPVAIYTGEIDVKVEEQELKVPETDVSKESVVTEQTVDVSDKSVASKESTPKVTDASVENVTPVDHTVEEINEPKEVPLEESSVVKQDESQKDVKLASEPEQPDTAVVKEEENKKAPVYAEGEDVVEKVDPSIPSAASDPVVKVEEPIAIVTDLTVNDQEAKDKVEVLSHEDVPKETPEVPKQDDEKIVSIPESSLSTDTPVVIEEQKVTDDTLHKNAEAVSDPLLAVINSRVGGQDEGETDSKNEKPEDVVEGEKSIEEQALNSSSEQVDEQEKPVVVESEKPENPPTIKVDDPISMAEPVPESEKVLPNEIPAVIIETPSKEVDEPQQQKSEPTTLVKLSEDLKENDVKIQEATTEEPKLPVSEVQQEEDDDVQVEISKKI